MEFKTLPLQNITKVAKYLKTWGKCQRGTNRRLIFLLKITNIHPCIPGIPLPLYFLSKPVFPPAVDLRGRGGEGVLRQPADPLRPPRPQGLQELQDRHGPQGCQPRPRPPDCEGQVRSIVRCYYTGPDHLQGVFFYWSPLNLAMSQSLYEIPYFNFFSRILLLVLGLSQI